MRAIHWSKVTEPRHAPGLVSPPARSERVAGSRSGTACDPVAARQRRASSRTLTTSGPANCVIAQRRLRLRRVRQRPPDLGRIDRLQRRAHRRHDPEPRALLERLRHERVELRRAQDRPRHPALADRLLLRELELVVRPADPVDADDRDEHVMACTPASRPAASSRSAPATSTFLLPLAASRTTSTPSSASASPAPVARSTLYSGACRDSTRTACPRSLRTRAASRPTVPVPPTIAMFI